MRISGGLTKIAKELEKIKRIKPERGIHGPMHALAKEISETFGEPNKFAMYLGIIKNIGLRQAYQIFSKIKQSENVKTPGKLFVYMSSQSESKYKHSPSPRLRRTKENGNRKKTKRNTK
jgi:hypothetical protein